MIGGLGTGVYTTWRHRGATPRARTWANRIVPGGFSEGIVLIHQPFAAVIAVSLGVGLMLPSGSPFLALVGLIMFPAMIAYLALLLLPTPKFLKPNWYRDQVTETWT